MGFIPSVRTDLVEKEASPSGWLLFLVCPTRFELATYRVGVCHSIQLSYGHGYVLKKHCKEGKISFLFTKPALSAIIS